MIESKDIVNFELLNTLTILLFLNTLAIDALNDTVFLFTTIISNSSSVLEMN